MYKLSPFNKDLVRFVFKPLRFGKANNEFSIWRFCPMNELNKAYSQLQSCNICKPDLFPFIFWFVLALSVCGAACTLNQVLKLSVCQKSKLSMWRNREFHVFSCQILRRARLMGACTMLTTWCMLILGFFKLEPLLMHPWIVINSFVIVCEIIAWVYEVMTGHVLLELHTGLTLILPCLHIVMVKCVQDVMEKSLIDRVDHSLRIF